MGRPELPVDHTVLARGELAEALRALRAEAGLTYGELAVRTGLSPATLKRAASGRTVPPWETVKEFASACGPLRPASTRLAQGPDRRAGAPEAAAAAPLAGARVHDVAVDGVCAVDRCGADRLLEAGDQR
ncbi:helix-turn-helix domain-containing protein [Streptomyces sp. NPDC059496]|uniref:helix-turn-helix domain-containing protein n=1 Tax=Streptomyces sp. NPDC059496 TaxID=3346851 RepID=UPI00369E04A6